MDKAIKRQELQDELIFNVTEDLLIAMEDAGVTRAELARRMNKSKSRVSQMLAGNSNITLRTLASMCFELGVGVDVRIGNEYSVRDPRSVPGFVDLEVEKFEAPSTQSYRAPIRVSDKGGRSQARPAWSAWETVVEGVA